MVGLVKGDVVVVPFPFSDLSQSKRRPALVVATLSGNDIILCMITSQARSDGYSINLQQSDFTSGGLHKPSMIRPNRLFTADSTIVVSKAGEVNTAKIKDVIKKIIRIVRT